MKTYDVLKTKRFIVEVDRRTDITDYYAVEATTLEKAIEAVKNDDSHIRLVHTEDHGSLFAPTYADSHEASATEWEGVMS